MKRSSLYALVLLAGCGSVLAGSLALEYDGPTRRLEATFTPAEGQSIDPQKTFVKFEAYGCMVRVNGTAAASGCVPLPASGIVSTTLEAIEPGATVDVSVWVDEPPKPTDENPEPQEPRPCQGVMIDRATWTSTLTAPVEPEPDPPGRASRPSTVEICGPESGELQIQNVGDGDLEIRSVASDPESSTQMEIDEMPVVLEPNQTFTADVRLADGVEFANVHIGTSDPDAPTVTVSVRALDRHLIAPDRLDFEPGQRRNSFEIGVSCGDLGELDVALVALASDEEGESLDDFFVEGCDELPCTIDDPSRIGIVYENDDNSDSDVAILRFTTAWDEARDVLLVAPDADCVAEEPMFTFSSTTTCVGDSVLLDAGDTGAASHLWKVLVPMTETTIEDHMDGTATLMPKEPGTHVVSLETINDCGDVSSPFVDVIEVDETCTD